jgi:hypothetical protein
MVIKIQDQLVRLDTQPGRSKVSPGGIDQPPIVPSPASAEFRTRPASASTAAVTAKAGQVRLFSFEPPLRNFNTAACTVPLPGHEFVNSGACRFLRADL